MPAEITDVACGDDYTDAATIAGKYPCAVGFYVVADAPVFAEIETGPHGMGAFGREFKVSPGQGTIYPGATGIRFRNYTAGSAATVTAVLFAPDESGIAGAFLGAAAAGVDPVSIPVGVSSSGSTTLVAGVSGKSVKVRAVAIMAAPGGVGVKFQTSTGPTDLTGTYTLVGSTGFVMSPSAAGVPWFKTGSGDGLLIHLDAAVFVGGVILYTIE